jgi:hypothetical protein
MFPPLFGLLVNYPPQIMMPRILMASFMFLFPGSLLFPAGLAIVGHLKLRTAIANIENHASSFSNNSPCPAEIVREELAEALEDWAPPSVSAPESPDSCFLDLQVLTLILISSFVSVIFFPQLRHRPRLSNKCSYPQFGQ